MSAADAGFELLKAALVDIDGTLIDSVDLHAVAWQKPAAVLFQSQRLFVADLCALTHRR
jgi:beta-phosphoglucomutase-like phosphatase (HAD superfamily)